MADTAIDFWKNGIISYIRANEPDMTHRQMAVLMIVHAEPGPHTVRGIAKKLNVSKPVITRALDKLAALGYLRRLPDETDGRSVFVVATSEGARFLGKFEKYFANQSGSEAKERMYA